MQRPLTADFAHEMKRTGLPLDFAHFLGYLQMRSLLEILKRVGRSFKAYTLSAAEGLGTVDVGAIPCASERSSTTTDPIWWI